MFGVDKNAHEQVIIDWAGWQASEDGLLNRVKAVSQRISERVRNVLGDETDEYVPLPSSPAGATPAAE